VQILPRIPATVARNRQPARLERGLAAAHLTCGNFLARLCVLLTEVPGTPLEASLLATTVGRGSRLRDEYSFSVPARFFICHPTPQSPSDRRGDRSRRPTPALYHRQSLRRGLLEHLSPSGSARPGSADCSPLRCRGHLASKATTCRLDTRLSCKCSGGDGRSAEIAEGGGASATLEPVLARLLVAAWRPYAGIRLAFQRHRKHASHATWIAAILVILLVVMFA
jgi:hypothetical protein